MILKYIGKIYVYESPEAITGYIFINVIFFKYFQVLKSILVRIMLLLLLLLLLLFVTLWLAYYKVDVYD